MALSRILSLPKSLLWILGVPLTSFCAVVSADDNKELFNMSLEELLNVKIQVGTRTGDNRLENYNVPVTVITAEQLQKSGYDDLPKALNHLLSSFTYAFATIDDLTDHVRPFSLNGLMADQVLVLINGKRLHQSAIVLTDDSQMRGGTTTDLSLIPIETIQRIEVLRDDASAIYGSDAIAGVINIVLKHGPANVASLRVGQRQAGDGSSANATYSLGNDQLFSSLGYRNKQHSNTSGLDRRDYYFDGDPRNGNYQVTHRYGDPDSQSINLTLNGEATGDEQESVYYFGKLEHKTSEATGFFRRPRDNRNIRAIHPDGFLPALEPTQLDIFASVGYRQDVGDIHYDLSNTLGYNKIDIAVGNSLNASLGLASPTHFNAGSMAFWQNTVNLDAITSLGDVTQQTDVNLAFGAELRYEKHQIFAGEKASWVDGLVPVLDGPNAGADTAAGAQLYPGFKDTNAGSRDRQVIAIYGELSHFFTRKLEGIFALRDEHYSDFGNTLNGKSTIAYALADDIKLRASVSSGFRAPSLHQLNYYRTSTQFLSTDQVQGSENGTFPVDNDVARLLGARALKPEKSRRESTGFTWKITSAFDISADYFRTRIADRIALTSNIDANAAIPKAATDYMLANGISSAQYFMNAIDSSTEGIEVAANYTTEVASNPLRLALLFNHNHTGINRIRIPNELSQLRDEIFDRIEQERLMHYLPDDKASVQLNYDLNKWGLTLRATRFGKVLYVRDASDISKDQVFAAKTTVDLDVGYRLDEHWLISLGALNLFNVQPDYRTSNPPFNGKDNIFQFRGTGPFDYTGAFYYLRTEKQF